MCINDSGQCFEYNFKYKIKYVIIMMGIEMFSNVKSKRRSRTSTIERIMYVV